jgi:hypothetical protein
MLNKYSILTMASKSVCKILDAQLAKYDQIGIKPWHHMVIENGLVFVYVWDTRVIELVIPESCLQADDITYATNDNSMDLVCPFNAKPNIYEQCMANRENMPIMFPGETMTDDEKALLDIIHY